MGWKFTKFTNSCFLLSLWHILNIQVGSLKTEILYLKTGSLQLTAPLSPTCKDLSAPWPPSSHGEEGLPNMTMGIWWEQCHRNYVGSENGEGKELWNLGRARGSWPGGQNPRQDWPAYVLTNWLSLGPKIASLQGLHFFHSRCFVGAAWNSTG